MGATGLNGRVCGSLRLSGRSDSFLRTCEQIAVFVLLLHLPDCVLSGRRQDRWPEGAGRLLS